MDKSLKDKKILVTGATGFIGSNLVRTLVARGAKVTAMKRPSSSVWRLKDISEQIEILEVDLRDYKGIKKSLNKRRFQIIFHLASHIDRSRFAKISGDTLGVNILGTLHLIDCFLKRDIEMFVNTGTCDEYGDNPVPFNEDQRERPQSPYAASKVVATHYCQLLFRTARLPVVIVRPFLTYGPCQIGEMLIPYVIERCLKSSRLKVTPGEQTREVHYIDDIVEGFIKAATCEKAVGQVINLGTGCEYKVGAIVSLIVKLTGYGKKWSLGELPYRENEMLRFYCDGQKAKEILMWKPRITLTEGLARTIEWYKSYLGL
jgi:UDP-glucose 4-epimerase